MTTSATTILANYTLIMPALRNELFLYYNEGASYKVPRRSEVISEETNETAPLARESVLQTARPM